MRWMMGSPKVPTPCMSLNTTMPLTAQVDDNTTAQSY